MNFSIRRLRPTHQRLIFCALLLVLALPAARAQYSAAPPSMGTVQRGLPAFLQQAGIAQNLNRQLPLSAKFIDSTGRPVAFGQFFSTRPVVLQEVYFRCPMLCPQVMHGAADSLQPTGLKPGRDYDVVIVSFDPADTPADAAQEKQRFLGWLHDPAAAAGVHFLTGQQPAIDALNAATGFHTVRVPGPDGKLDQFAHASVLMVATPDGRLSKYFAGIQYPPRDLRLALVEASNHRIGTMSDLFLLYCCNYSAAQGRYTVRILRVLGLAGMITILIMAGIFYLLTRKPKGRTFPPTTAV